MAVLLCDLPDEIIQAVLVHVRPIDLAAVQLTSNRLNRLANAPLLWRHHCRIQYKYWDAKHHVRVKFAGSVFSAEWKELYAYRCRVAKKTTKLLNSIIATQTGRIEKFEEAVEPGYDVKDTLLENMHVSEDEVDSLARRYWSKRLLTFLHRSMALKTWCEVRSNAAVSLQRALLSYDMCVLGGQKGDYDEVSDHLDGLVQQFRGVSVEHEDLTPRRQALALARFVRDHDLTGVDGDEDYLRLDNGFIGFALRNPPHRSMPLISVAIYCSLAARLGINAQPIGFPLHVYAIVHPPSSVTLDGKPCSSSVAASEPMYLDPFRSDLEVPLETLKEQLNLMGIFSHDHARHISPASVSAITIRQGHNLLSAYNNIFATPPLAPSREPIDRDAALHAIKWALLSTSPSLHDRSILYRGPHIDSLLIPMLVRISEQYAEDVSLLETHILPFVSDHPHFPEWQLRTAAIHTDGKKPKVLQSRHAAADRTPKFRVGQVFRHKRYDYSAVITGWDKKCQQDDGWVAHMGVDRLPRGRAQAFYHALVEDQSMRYVAEENIGILHDWTPQGELMDIAGQYFKRWDNEKREFVSNIREEYPDD